MQKSTVYTQLKNSCGCHSQASVLCIVLVSTIQFIPSLARHTSCTEASATACLEPAHAEHPREVFTIHDAALCCWFNCRALSDKDQKWVAAVASKLGGVLQQQI